jgi:hypothetical protein
MRLLPKLPTLHPTRRKLRLGGDPGCQRLTIETRTATEAKVIAVIARDRKAKRLAIFFSFPPGEYSFPSSGDGRRSAALQAHAGVGNVEHLLAQ